MDKQKQIEGMAQTLCKKYNHGEIFCSYENAKCDLCCCDAEKAQLLVNAGYGNLKEFASFIKGKLFDLGNVITEQDIDDLLKEYLNE